MSWPSPRSISKLSVAGPARRRAFLDRAMISVYPGHMQGLAAYCRTLKHRNHMLGAALAQRQEAGSDAAGKLG